MKNLNTWKIYASHLGDYMRRWILRSPWGTLRIHHILKSDEGRDFHDHPFGFVSFIFSGGYREHVPGCTCFADRAAFTEPTPCRSYISPAIVRRRATDLHRLEVPIGGAWTFVVSARYFRMWGFLTPSGWVNYQEYGRSFYQPAEAHQ